MNKEELNQALNGNGEIPIYPHDRKYAMEHGELKQCRASYDENVACKEAIEKTIREGFDGFYLSGSVAKDVLNSFSADRVSYVLAATLQEKQHDGRFSRSNKEWAETVPVHDAAEDRLGYVVQTHPAVLNGFINLARQEMKTAREQPEKKPSIRAQLAKKPEKPRQEELEKTKVHEQNQNKGEAAL